jgi:hypothetical protein
MFLKLRNDKEMKKKRTKTKRTKTKRTKTKKKRVVKRYKNTPANSALLRSGSPHESEFWKLISLVDKLRCNFASGTRDAILELALSMYSLKDLKDFEEMYVKKCRSVGKVVSTLSTDWGGRDDHVDIDLPSSLIALGKTMFYNTTKSNLLLLAFSRSKEVCEGGLSAFFVDIAESEPR